MWIGLVAMKTWMRDRFAPASDCAAASRSSSRVRARAATVGRSTAAATARTPSKSPGEETANPASTTSTPSRSSCVPISAFSSGESAMPGDCSPSRNVVSKIVILRLTAHPPCLQTEAHYFCGKVGVCACSARERVLPLEGENAEENDDEAARRRLGEADDALGCDGGARQADCSVVKRLGACQAPM